MKPMTSMNFNSKLDQPTNHHKPTSLLYPSKPPTLAPEVASAASRPLQDFDGAIKVTRL